MPFGQDCGLNHLLYCYDPNLCVCFCYSCIAACYKYTLTLFYRVIANHKKLLFYTLTSFSNITLFLAQDMVNKISESIKVCNKNEK
jgi:hypothetical protein